MLKKLVPILIIVSLVLIPTVQTAQAEVLDYVIGFGSCAAAGFISNLISKGLSDLQDWVTAKLKNWLDIGTFSSLLGGEVPVTDDDTHEKIDSFQGVYTSKEAIEDIIARCAAREVLTAMGRDIMNVSRTGGRDGGVAWVRNWRNFQLDAQYRGEGIFRGMLNSTNLCNYFGSDLKSLFGANERIDLTRIRTRSNDFDSFQAKAGCTLPSNFDFNAYKQNFSGNGGWEAWSRLLEPQNNFYGTLFQSLDEANKQRAIEESADISEAGPTGFTSIRGRSATESCAVRSPSEGGCLIYKDILTPGGILSGAVIEGIATELEWVATTDELNELIAVGIEVLINRLWDLSNPNEGDYIVPGKPEVSLTPFPESTSGPNPVDTCLQSCDAQFCIDELRQPDPSCQNISDINAYTACVDACFGNNIGNTLACNMTWAAPRLVDGKGQRYIGDLANVNVSLNGFSANASVQLQHNGPTTVVGPPMQVGANGSYAYYDSTPIGNNFQSGFYNTWVIDAATQSFITSCDIGFKIESSGPVGNTLACNMTWAAPRLADGKGQRYIGDLANVNVSLNGLSSNALVQLQHNGPTTVVGSPIQVGANGSYAYYDSTPIGNNFQSGFYNTWVIDAATQNFITSCDIGFKIE